MANKTPKEEFVLDGQRLRDGTQKIINEGSSRYLVVRSGSGRLLFEMSLLLAVIVGILLSIITIIALIIALATDCRISIEKRQ